MRDSAVISPQLSLPAQEAPPRLSGAQALAAWPLTQGVRVVVGGPGTGKTEALTAFVEERVREGAALDRLVVLASSRQEAQRLRRAVIRRTGGAQVFARITTVHGLALGWLRTHGDQEADWRLLRAPEQELRIRELLDALGPGFWPSELREAVATRSFARQLREMLARARQLGMDPADVADGHQDRLLAAVAKFFDSYLTISDFDGSLDYAELVHRARLLLADAEVGEAVKASTEALVVDDAEALDPAQLGLLTDCAALGIPVLVFADPQQRIHDFRGATPLVVPTLLSLPGAERIDLSQGHRNSPAVARALGNLRLRMAHNHAAPPPAPARGAEGKVTCSVHDDQASELAHIAAALRRSVLVDGLQWHELAVVVRAGRSQLGPLARELARYQIPVEVAGDELPLAGQPAVGILLLALSAAATDGDVDEDTARRLLASPLCGLDGVGFRTLGRELLAHRPDDGNSVQLVRRCLASPELLEGLESESARAVARLAALLHSVRRGLAGNGGVQEALWGLWSGTNWPQSLRERALAGSSSANQDLDAVVELFEFGERREHLAGPGGARTFVVQVSGEEIPADTGRELQLAGKGVRLLTAHRARTGAWRRVWVAGVQEGSWPRLVTRGLLLDPARLQGQVLGPQLHAERLASERRLFHVACARAAEELHVSASEGVEGEGTRPSRFLDELGVPVQRAHGLPPERLTPAALVGELRRVAADDTQPQGLRRAAALRLAGLARASDAGWTRPAAPENWWGVAEPTSPAPSPPRVVRLSGSQLQTLLDCPRRWFLSRRAAADHGPGSRASVGDLVHALAERAVTEDLDAEELKTQLDHVWDDISFEAEWLAASERVEIEAALDRYAAWHSAEPGEVLGVEVSFDVPLEVGGRQVRLVGKVDRLQLHQGALEVVDIKTGRHLPTARDVADDAQLGVYQLAASLGAFDTLAPGVRAVAEPSLLYLRHGDFLPARVKQPSIDTTPHLKGEEPVAGPTWVHDRLATAVATIDSGEFPARVCDSCRWCPFAAACPALHPGQRQVGE